MEERRYSVKADFLLLVTAIIWGFAFVAQRVGMESIGPFAYNAARFAIGAAVLVPLRFFLKRRRAVTAATPAAAVPAGAPRRALLGGLAAGAVLFAASSLQQVGIVTTTAGNAGFITGLYIVIVPALYAFFGKKVGVFLWIGAACAVAGLYFLSVGEGFAIRAGDLVVLVGAFFWAFHILVIDRLAPVVDPLDLAIGQFATASALSLAVALAVEPNAFAGFAPALVPILYGGVLSIGVAFTLQIVAQKHAHPARASIILAMESPFAGIGGVLLLAEPVTVRIVAGAVLMLAGMVLAQRDGAHASAEPAAALASGTDEPAPADGSTAPSGTAAEDGKKDRGHA